MAPEIYKGLLLIAKSIQEGKTNFFDLEKIEKNRLETLGFKTDYVTILDYLTLMPVNQDTKNYIILTAARLGKTRLIDNFILQ